MRLLLTGIFLLLTLTAHPVPALAQDALVLTPDGVQPWMQIPGGRYGADLWIPMAPPIGTYGPLGGPTHDAESLRQELQGLRRDFQMQETFEALERMRQERYDRMPEYSKP